MPLADSIDRAILAVSPEWALRRAQARLAHSAVASYEAARPSRRTRGWIAGNTSANAEVRDSLPRLRDRARSLVRDNPYAAAALDVLVAYQVGTGITPRSATGDAALDRQANDAFAAWAAATNYYALQAQIARGRIESGEMLVRLQDLSAATARQRGLAVPFALTALEPDYLDDSRDHKLSDGTTIVNGVEISPSGVIAAYWMFREHPGDNYVFALRGYSSKREAAGDILHIYRADRAGQMRGVTDLAPVMLRMRGLDDYEDALLEQARVQACLSVFVRSSGDASKAPLAGTRDADSGQLRRSLAPGMIERLRPGDDIQTVSPPASNGAGTHRRDVLHAIATGLGLTYDLLTGDLSGANYSSLRAGRLAFRRRTESVIWNLLVPQLCEPVWQRWCEAAQRANVLPFREGPWPVKHTPPRFEMLDPAAEIAAQRDAIRNGLSSWDDAVSENGQDPDQLQAEIAARNAQWDNAGLILDCDPRRIARSAGNAQDAAQNARVEISAR